MVFRWKLDGLYPVDAQTAGEELERIYQQRGALVPAEVVEESKPADAPLHPCFEWNDEAAAQKYREQQARTLIGCIVEVRPPEEGPTEVRAFVRAQSSYHPVRVVLDDETKREEMLGAALRELGWFRRKYANLTALSAVMEAIDQLQIDN